MFDETIMKAFSTLAISVAGLGILLYILKRINKKHKGQLGNNVELQIISKISLQPKTSLFVVKAGRKTLLIGSNEKGINAIADLTEPAAQPQAAYPARQTLTAATLKAKQERPATTTPAAAESPLSFKSFLKATLQKS